MPFYFVFEIKNKTKKSRMPITRSKRTADPMISLSAVKKRRIAKDVGKDLVNEEAEEIQEKSPKLPSLRKTVDVMWRKIFSKVFFIHAIFYSKYALYLGTISLYLFV